MENQSEERTTAELFSEYSGLLLQWSWLLILLAILAGGTAYYISNQGTRIYQTTTLVMLNGAPGYQSDPYSASIVGQQLATTYAKVMVTRPVLDSVAKRMGLTDFPGAASVSVSPVTDTQLMTIVVQDTDPDRAALIANTLVSVFAEQIQTDQTSRYADSKKSLEDQMATLNQHILDSNAAITETNQNILDTNNALTEIINQIVNDTKALASTDVLDADKAKRDQLESSLVQYQSQLTQLQTTQSQYQYTYNNLFQSYQSILLAQAQTTSSFIQKSPAIPNRNPIAPQPVRSALLAAVVGLMIAAGIVILVEFLDDTIRDPQAITRKWGVPILGMIVSYKSTKGEQLITVRHPRSPVSEAFRSLRTNLQFASVDTPIRTLLVTSPSPSDGKTTVVSNLASVIAQGGRNVVIVDADLRRPRIHKMFQLSNRVGLSDQFIQTQDHFDGSLKSTEITNLHALTSGNLPPNPSELLSSARMVEILRQLSNKFSTVIVDSPPVLLVTDALVLAPRVDGVILVIKPSVTKWSSLRQALDQLQHIKANLLGVVVNDVNLSRSRYYYYRGYYSQKYGKGYHYAEKEVPERAAEPKVIVTDPSAARQALLRTMKSTDQKK
jgi:polysaccharide biosynthesis transport protein